MNKRTGLLILWLLTLLPGWAQVDFRTQVSQTDIGPEDRIRVDFVLNRRPEDFRPPSFEDFFVVMGPMESSSSQISMVNGRISRHEVYTFSYVLAPRKPGTLTIGPAEAVVDGKTYRTRPVHIQVSRQMTVPPPSTTGKPGNPPPATAPQGKDAFIRIELTDSQPYVGQGIGAVYKLYVKQDVEIADYGQINISEPKGFWVETISEKPVSAGIVPINGEPYKVYILRKLLLIPQHAGTLEITPQKVELILVRKVLRQYGPFQVYEDVPKRVLLSTQRVRIKARPLPEEGKPVDFSGAVGQFDFFVVPQDTIGRTGEDLQVQVKVTGTGNLNMFDLPRPAFPPEWEVYEPEHKVDTRPTFKGYRGAVTDTYTAIPQQPGKYTLPPLSFSYFDPADGRYKRLSSRAYTFEISGGTIASTTTPAPASSVTALADIETRTRWQKANEKPYWQRPWFGRLTAAPFVLFLLILLAWGWKKSRRPDEQKRQKERQNKYIRTLLKEAASATGDASRFYGLLEKALRTYLQNRLHLTAAQMQRGRIADALEQAGVPASLREQLFALWDHIQAARYTPAAPGATRDDYEKLRRLLEQTDKILKK